MRGNYSNTRIVIMDNGLTFTVSIASADFEYTHHTEENWRTWVFEESIIWGWGISNGMK